MKENHNIAVRNQTCVEENHNIAVRKKTRVEENHDIAARNQICVEENHDLDNRIIVAKNSESLLPMPPCKNDVYKYYNNPQLK